MAGGVEGCALWAATQPDITQRNARLCVHAPEKAEVGPRNTEINTSMDQGTTAARGDNQARSLARTRAVTDNGVDRCPTSFLLVEMTVKISAIQNHQLRERTTVVTMHEDTICSERDVLSAVRLDVP